MDVYVDARRVDGDVQNAAGEFAGHDAAFVRRVQSRVQRLGLYRPVVDEKILHIPVPAREQGLCNIASDGHAVHLVLDRQKGLRHFRAQHGVDCVSEHAVARREQLFPALADYAEGDFGMREGEPVGKGEDGARLAAHGFEKLLARGRIVKQVRDGDDRSVRAAERRLLGKGSALHADQRAGLVLGALGHQPDPGHRRDGGERLAAEAEGLDPVYVLRAADLARGMAQKAGARVGLAHARAVVLHADAGCAAVRYIHGDGGSAGVNGVFHEFLDDRSGAFHNLSGRDQLGGLFWQYGNFVHWLPPIRGYCFALWTSWCSLFSPSMGVSTSTSISFSS